jgi:hypothetical protein
MKIVRAALAVAGVWAAAGVWSEVKADFHEELYVKPEVAYVLPADGDVDDTIFLGAKVGYQMDENIALELESGWMEYGWDATDSVQNLDIQTIPVLGNFRYGQRCSDEEMGWYSYLGAGWAFNDLESNTLEARADGSFAWQIGAGIEIPVTQGLDAFLDLRYLWNRANIDIPNGANRVAPDDAVLSSVLFTGGVKF